MTRPTTPRRVRRLAAAALGSAAVLTLSGCGLMGGSAASSLSSPADAQGAGSATGSLDACSLLTKELAEQAIGNASTLVTESVAGGPECLWGSPAGTEPSQNFSVDLDLSAADGTTLATAREGYTGHTIADVSGAGDGAFSATVGTFASVDCVAGGVLHDITVGGPSDPPSAEAATRAAALASARALAVRFCGTPAAPVTAPAATGGSLDACSLLTRQLAERVIGDRSTLVTESVDGGPECLWVSPAGTEPSQNFSVDLDLSTDDGTALATAREGFTGHTIADESGFGEGAFSATVGTFASVDCVSGGVLHDITVGAPSDPPSAEAANRALALDAARALATRFCGSP